MRKYTRICPISYPHKLIQCLVLIEMHNLPFLCMYSSWDRHCGQKTTRASRRRGNERPIDTVEHIFSLTHNGADDFNWLGNRGARVLVCEEALSRPIALPQTDTRVCVRIGITASAHRLAGKASESWWHTFPPRWLTLVKRIDLSSAAEESRHRKSAFELNVKSNGIVFSMMWCFDFGSLAATSACQVF